MGKKITADDAMQALDRAPIAILKLDADLCCQYANPAAESFTGVNPAEIIDRSIWDTFPALHSTPFETQIARALIEQKRIPFEFFYAATARWFDVEAVPVASGLAIYLLDSTERHRAAASSMPARIGENMAGETAPVSSMGKTVLLVDDDESMRRVTRRILTRNGFRVIEAEHGADALRVSAAHEGKIDLLVTDVLMPGIRGPELVEELILRSPNLRVLYMSGYTEEDITRWGLQPGIAFIQKPFTSEGLAEAVNEVLRATR